eukprot:scaffold624_cov402-Prasinococcus_capsulatus_cf.AAC.76
MSTSTALALCSVTPSMPRCLPCLIAKESTRKRSRPIFCKATTLNVPLLVFAFGATWPGQVKVMLTHSRCNRVDSRCQPTCKPPPKYCAFATTRQVSRSSETFGLPSPSRIVQPCRAAAWTLMDGNRTSGARG